MLARYQMKRGARASQLPAGHRIDTRKHTHHILRPTPAMVSAYLAHPTSATWAVFRRAYLAELAARFHRDRGPFDAIADEARRSDVYLGCSCPTELNPDVHHCHTYLALRFMRERYPDLEVAFPA
ncbi:MAG: hypothetical protein KIT31_14605 [Deltaproteobacteria bacterium]|nr:hypothetical protein [Deltaproteobacteria bacterium]